MRKFLDGLFITLLALIALIGMRLAPFHGDESTIIYMGRDWYTYIVQRNPAALFYSDRPANPADQELRVLNGSIAGYSYGFAWSLLGNSANSLNGQWMWGNSWNQNLAQGTIPNPMLLFVARWAATCLLILSIALIFGTARQLLRGAGPYIATAIYATLPIVLLNGRRAVFESAFLCTTALLLCLSVRLINRLRHKTWIGWLGVGVAAGLNIASKHTALLVAVPILAILFLYSLRNLRVLLRAVVVSVSAMTFTFLALNPAWWSAPLRMPSIVLERRGTLAADQVRLFGGFASTTDRITSVVVMPFRAPQYYEDTRGWPNWIGDQIVAYEQSGFPGITWNGWLLPLVGLGLVVLIIRAWRHPRAQLLLVVVVCSAMGIFALNPLPWQRYYLPLAAPLALLIGIGSQWLICRLPHQRNRHVFQP